MSRIDAHHGGGFLIAQAARMSPLSSEAALRHFGLRNARSPSGSQAAPGTFSPPQVYLGNSQHNRQQSVARVCFNVHNPLKFRGELRRRN